MEAFGHIPKKSCKKWLITKWKRTLARLQPSANYSGEEDSDAKPALLRKLT